MAAGTSSFLCDTDEHAIYLNYNRKQGVKTYLRGSGSVTMAKPGSGGTATPGLEVKDLTVTAYGPLTASHNLYVGGKVQMEVDGGTF